LNENMKNICDFLYALNTEKCFRRKIFSRKMTSLKPFYEENHFMIETNGALIIVYSYYAINKEGIE
jgi:hypothetical protein